ncbi:MAG: glycosyltransferase family 39 protein [Chthoniobacterales bacterium]
MNRTGLLIALAVAVCTGAVFAIYPQLDLQIARIFFNNNTGRFVLAPVGAAEFVRRASMWIAWACAMPAMIAPLIKLFRPRKPLIVPGRAVIFLVSTILLTAVVLPNLLFKEYWGRPRPATTVEFNGAHRFKPWWDPRGTNPHNGSFFSGEAATAFWTYAPAALAPAPLRPVAFLAATLFGLATGILRMAFGAHYASDVIAAGTAAFLVTWLMHGWIYRWKKTQLDDERIDRTLGEAILRFRSSRLGLLIALLFALTIVRLIGLRFSVVDLFPDEARYWCWAQAPAFGYFSKPPFIAWIIAVANQICGDSEACLRSPAPVFYAGTALLTYGIARHLYGERAAFWSGLSIALATGTIFSARIMSTDVPLLFFWALALFAYVKVLDSPRWRWFILLGFALGVGLLAKYAMIYFFIGIAAVALIDPRGRRLLGNLRLWTAMLLALIIVAPNLIWNANHHFVTFAHTQANIEGTGFQLNPLSAFEFFGAQFAVCGPILFAVFLSALIFWSRFRLGAADRLMMAFALPSLVLVTALSLVASTNANWAATSAVSVTVLAVALLVRLESRRWLVWSVAIGVIFQIAVIGGDAFADRISLSWLAKPDVYHRTMGWKATASLVKQAAIDSGAQTIAAEQNAIEASLIYYLRGEKWPVVAWPTGIMPPNQFEAERPLTAAATEPILFVTERHLPQRLGEFYSNVDVVRPLNAPTGPHSYRRLFAFRLSGHRNDIAPLSTLKR